MNFLPTKILLRFLCFILFGLTVILGCSKDADEPYDAMDTTAVAKKTNAKASGSSKINIAAVIQGSIPSSARAPASIAFKGWGCINQAAIKSYFWDFKDGSTAKTINATHTFSKPGEYNVQLSVKNAAGQTHSTTRKITITGSSSSSGSSKINVAAVISGSIPTSAKAPATIDFKAWNSVNQKDIKGYFWNFNDGSTTTKKNPTHTFTKTGDFVVELSVKNAAGETHSTTRNIKITGTSTTNTGSSSGGSTSASSSGSGSSGSTSSTARTSGNYPSNAVMASSFGFKSGDATAAFEAAINSGKSYVVIDKQSSDWVIRPTRFFNLSNMTIVFEPGVTLRAKSGAFKEGARLFKLSGARNVTIEGTGATFKMNKNEYTSGEQRHAFMCNGITVRGLTIRDSGGAGIKLMGDTNSGYCQNITLENIRSLNNRRDGITITSAQDVWVRNSEFSGSSGTRPEAGVVLESDTANERLVNINFSNCKFADNESAGIHFSTNKMNGGSRSVSIKVVDSEFSNNAISPPSGFLPTEVEVGGGNGTSVVGGEIRFERVKFNGSRGGIVFTRKSANGFKAVFKDCEARNVVTSNSISPIRMEANSSRNTLGGIEFDNFYIQYNRDIPFMKIQAPSKSGNFDVKNVKGSFTVKEPGDNPLYYKGGYQTSKNVNVSINYKHI